MASVALALGLSLGGMFLFFAAIVVGRFFWKLRRVLQLKSEWSKSRVDEEAGGNDPATWAAELGLPKRYSYLELSFATGGFNPKELLGSGGFGHVFRGFVPPGDTVAVKRLSEDSKQGEREFVAEVSTIGQLRHRNLVQLKGWCFERRKMLLVYEYMPNGSLEKLLLSSKGRVLDWKKRYKIVEGVAAGLAYLHHGCEQQVIHRDVKASNVLLDRHYDPRLADFGLARQINHNKALETMTMAGTLGYVAPEMYYTGKASSKSDVYSFGVLLLVVASGRAPIDQRRLAHQEVMLLNSVWKMQEQEEVLEAADARLGGAFDATEMRRVLHLGLLCCFPDPEVRPTMRFCEDVLRGEMALPPVATSKPPLFYPVSFSNRLEDSPTQSRSAKEGSSTQYMSAKTNSFSAPPQSNVNGSFNASRQSNVSSPFSSVCDDLSGPSITPCDTPGSPASCKN